MSSVDKKGCTGVTSLRRVEGLVSVLLPASFPEAAFTVSQCFFVRAVATWTGVPFSHGCLFPGSDRIAKIAER